MALLCLLTFAGTARGAEAPAATTKLLVINDTQWSSTAIAINTSAEAPATIAFPACNSVGIPDVVIKPGGSARLENFGDCPGRAAARIVDVTTTGSVTLWIDAVFRDTSGYLNFVSIPPVTVWASSDTSTAIDTLLVTAAERTLEKPTKEKPTPAIAVSTFLALFAEGGDLNATVTIFDQDGNALPGPRSVSVSGFRWYELEELLPIGRVEIHPSQTIGCAGCTVPRLYAVAFCGYRAGGGPRVITPTLRHTAN